MKKISYKIKILILKLIYYIKNKNVNISSRACITKSKIDISKKGQFYLGKNSVINTGTIIRIRDNAKLSIGNNTGINSNVLITCRDNIYIGNNVLIGPNTMIFDHDHDYKSRLWHNEYKNEKIIIEDDVWIGCGAIILKGSHLKKGCIIGAGAIVKGCVEEKEIYICKQEIERKKFKR